MGNDNPIVVLQQEDLKATLRELIAPLAKELASLRQDFKALVANKPLLNRSEVGRMLGITHKQVSTISYEKGCKPRNKQKLAFEKVGDNYLYAIEDVLAYRKAFIREDTQDSPDNPNR